MNRSIRDALIAAFIKRNNLPTYDATTIPKVGKVAFWHNDANVLLSGTITSVREGREIDAYLNGHVATREYGTGHYFKPVICLSPERGRLLRLHLDQIAGSHRIAYLEADAARLRAVESLFQSFVVVPEPNSPPQ